MFDLSFLKKLLPQQSDGQSADNTPQLPAATADTAADAGPINHTGPPIPPDVAAALTKQDRAPSLPPEVLAVTGKNTADNALPPLDTLAASPGVGADQRPQLAKPHVGIMGRLKQALPYIGAVGGAMEAMGNGPQTELQGSKMLEQSLAGQRAADLKRRELEEVEKPKAKAYADYTSAENATKKEIATTNVAGRKDVANINANSKAQIAALSAGAGMVIQPEMAQIAGQPQLAGQTLSGKSLANFLKVYTATGAAVHDLGDEGMWSVDKAGNRIKRVTVSSPSVARANAFAEAKARNTPVNVLDIDENGNPIMRAISQKEQLATGTPTASTENTVLGPTGDMRNKGAIAERARQAGQRVLEDLKDPNIAAKIGPLIGRAGNLENALGIMPPELAETAQDLKSFAQFVGGQHPVRGLNALEAFEKAIGGIGQDPATLIAKINSQMKTSDFVANQGVIKPNRANVPRKPQSQGGGAAPKKGDPLGIL